MRIISIILKKYELLTPPERIHRGSKNNKS